MTRYLQRLILLAVVLLLILSGGLIGIAQTKKTIILVRHAEKDAVQSATSDDPELSPEGRQRAERLVTKIGKYRPGAIFASNYLRTLDTAAPMAKRRGLKVQIYDPEKQDDLVKQIMSSRTKRFLIVGHGHSIPPLANLLIKKNLFQSLDENEFGTIWVIRFKHGEFSKVEILHY